MKGGLEVSFLFTSVMRLATFCFVAFNLLILTSCERQPPGPPHNSPPIASFTVSEAYKNEITQFHFTGSDPDGDALQFYWQFGDGDVSYQENPQHIYRSTGWYNVRLVVEDVKGARATQTLFIRVYVRQILNRWPTESDGPPTQRESPITRISHQKNDERPGWQWTRVENTNHWHWQHDVKIEDDELSKKIHGNSDNHRLQVGEPAIFKTNTGYRLQFYIKHDRIGANPIIGFTVYIEHGRVTKIDARNIRKAGNLESLTVDLIRKGINIGVDIILNWATGGLITLYGSTWLLLDWLFPEDWLHQYRGWQLDAFWFAAQVGDLYAKELPVF